MAAQDITGEPWPRWRLFLGLTVVATVGLLWVSRRFFQKALRSYRSASS